MPAILLAVLLATATMMAIVVGMPLALYDRVAEPGQPVEWAETLAIAILCFSVSGVVVLEPVIKWGRNRPKPRPGLGIWLAGTLWAVLAALVFTAVLTVLGAREAAIRMDLPFWPVLGDTVTAFEWVILTGILFFPLMICCLLGGLAYAWSRAGKG